MNSEQGVSVEIVPSTLEACFLRPLVWSVTGDPLAPFEARSEGRLWRVLLGDFPDEPLYTLQIEATTIGSFDDWPGLWDRPAMWARDLAASAESPGGSS